MTCSESTSRTAKAPPATTQAATLTEISFVLNGHETTVAVRSSDLLLDVLRDTLGWVGTKEGCGKGECGACTVLIDERPVNACLYPVLEAEGRTITTIEGLAGPHGELSVLQQAFVEKGGIQCGFCSPGMIMAAKALLDRHPEPTDEQIRDALVGNLCRCTGYVQIVDSVRYAAAIAAGDAPPPTREAPVPPSTERGSDQ